MTYKEIWQSLETSVSEQPDGYVRRRVKLQSICSIFLAVRKPFNQHMLQIQLTAVSTKILADLPSARGLEVTVHHSENDDNGFILQLTLKEHRFDKVFDVLPLAKIPGAGWPGWSK